MTTRIAPFVLAMLLTTTGCLQGTDLDRERIGHVRARLSLPDGYEITELHYEVRGGPLDILRSGTLDLRHSASIDFNLGALPIGPGYVLTLETTLEGDIRCHAEQEFAVSGPGVDQLEVMLTCSEPKYDEARTGRVVVKAAVNLREPQVIHCPVVTGINVSPLSVFAGYPVDLEAFTSSPPDGALWSAEHGSFEVPEQAATRFSSSTPGMVELTYTVFKDGCPDTFETTLLEIAQPVP